MKRKFTQDAFTLIELLLVIAIISFMAILVMANVSNSRVKAKEVKMVSDLSNANRSAGICVNDDGGLSGLKADYTKLPIPGNSLCSGSSLISAKWPALAPGWSYTYFFNPTPLEWTGKVTKEVTGKEVTFSSQGVNDITDFISHTRRKFGIDCRIHHCNNASITLSSQFNKQGLIYVVIPITLTNYYGLSEYVYFPDNFSYYLTFEWTSEPTLIRRRSAKMSPDTIPRGITMPDYVSWVPN